MYDIFNLRRASAWLRRSHTHQTFSQYEFRARESFWRETFFFSGTQNFVGGVRRITQNSHTRVLEGIFQRMNATVYLQSDATRKTNEGGIMQASDRLFLKIFFSSRSPKKISPEKLPHTLQLDSIFFSDILSLMHLCWWAGFCVFTRWWFFFEIIMGNFLLRFLKYFFGPIFKLFHAIFG